MSNRGRKRKQVVEPKPAEEVGPPPDVVVEDPEKVGSSGPVAWMCWNCQVERPINEWVCSECGEKRGPTTLLIQPPSEEVGEVLPSADVDFKAVVSASFVGPAPDVVVELGTNPVSDDSSIDDVLLQLVGYPPEPPSELSPEPKKPKPTFETPVMRRPRTLAERHAWHAQVKVSHEEIGLDERILGPVLYEDQDVDVVAVMLTRSVAALTGLPIASIRTSAIEDLVAKCRTAWPELRRSPLRAFMDGRLTREKPFPGIPVYHVERINRLIEISDILQTAALIQQYDDNHREDKKKLKVDLLEVEKPAEAVPTEPVNPLFIQRGPMLDKIWCCLFCGSQIDDGKDPPGYLVCPCCLAKASATASDNRGRIVLLRRARQKIVRACNQDEPLWAERHWCMVCHWSGRLDIEVERCPRCRTKSMEDFRDANLIWTDKCRRHTENRDVQFVGPGKVGASGAA